MFRREKRQDDNMQPEPENGDLPSDFRQAMTVAEHEIRRYVKTKRFLGIAIVVLAAVLFVFSLPYLSGEHYSGRVEEEGYPAGLDSEIYPEYHSYLWLSRSDVVIDTLEIHVNGSVLQESQWSYFSGQGPIIFFKSDLSGSVVSVSYRYAMRDIDMAKNLLFPFKYIVAFCASLFGADALVGEIQSRTAYLLFPNPLKRSAIFCGKILASLVVGVLIVLLFFSLITLLSLITLGTVAGYLHISFGFAVLYLAACLTLSFAISALAKGSVGALVTTLLLLLLVSPLAQAAGASAGSDVWYVPTFAADTIIYSLQWDDYPRDVTDNTSIPTYYPDPAASALVLVGYSSMFMAIGMMFFRRRELLGHT